MELDGKDIIKIGMFDGSFLRIRKLKKNKFLQSAKVQLINLKLKDKKI